MSDEPPKPWPRNVIEIDRSRWHTYYHPKGAPARRQWQADAARQAAARRSVDESALRMLIRTAYLDVVERLRAGSAIADVKGARPPVRKRPLPARPAMGLNGGLNPATAT